MFCRKCGKTLLDGDRFCSYCGAQVIERNDNGCGGENVEEVIYNNIPASTDALGVQAPKKSIAQTWQEINENSADKPPRWNLEGYPITNEENRKTEDIVVDWSSKRVVGSEEENRPRYPHTRKDLLERGRTRIIEKRKIEECCEKQEPIKQESIKQEPEDIENKVSFDLETELFGERSNLQFEQTPSGSASIEKFYTFSKKNEEFQKLLDKEYERLKVDGMPERKETSNIENLGILQDGDSQITGIEKILQQDTELDSPIINMEEPSVETEKFASSIPFWSKVSLSQMPKTENLGVDLIKKESVAEVLPMAVTPILEEDKTIGVTEEEPADKQEVEGNVDDVDNVILPWDELDMAQQEFVDEDANKKKLSPVKVILTILIVLITCEIAILGVKYFFPESGAAKLINDNLGLAVNWIDDLKDSSDRKKTQEDSDKNADAESEPVSTKDSKQSEERDLNEVLDPLRIYNQNIKSISVNEALVYDKAKDYGDENINNSEPIEDNIWYQDTEGNNVYLDSEIFKTLICYDSLWIDYLDGKNREVLDFTKKGSFAYNSAKNFTKKGKISEVFNALELGEIRKGQKGYYIWVKEDFDVTENKTVKNRAVNYIYYLEPVEQELKIVNFIEY